MERNFSLQCGLKVTNKYYLANDVYTVEDRSDKEMFFIFSSDCDPDKGSNYNCKLMDLDASPVNLIVVIQRNGITSL